MNFKNIVKKAVSDENFGWMTEEMCHEFKLSNHPTIQGLSHQHLLPLDKSVGKAFLKAELYSQGLDFTHSWQEKKDHENRSYLKRIWKGEKNLSHHDSVCCWTLLDLQNQESPIGIAVLEQTQHSLIDIGRHKAYEVGGFSVYINPLYRRKSLMKDLINEHVISILEKGVKTAQQMKATPFIGAEDAAQNLLLQSSFDGMIIPFHHTTPERTEYLKNALSNSSPNLAKTVVKSKVK